MILISNYDITRLYSLLMKVSIADINKSKKLLFICVVVYSEIGKNLDAKFYLDKYRKMVETGDEVDKKVVEYCSCKIRFSLGEINANDFSDAIGNIIKYFPGNDHNNLVLRINAVYFQLGSHLGSHKVPASIKESINEIYNLIDKADIEERVKWLLRIWNTENFIFYNGDVRRENLSEIKFREALGSNVPLEEKKATIITEMAVQQTINKVFIDAKKYGDEKGDEIISAYALNGFLKNAINSQIDYYSFGEGKSFNVADSIVQFTNLVKYGTAAAQSFFNNAYLKEAYCSLRNAWEILTLAKKGFGYQLELGFDENVIMNNINSLERELDMPTYQSVFEGLIEKNQRNQKKKPANDMSFIKDLSDEQIEMVARYTLAGFGLPAERLMNVIGEMKGYRMFYQRNKNPDIEVLQVREDGGIRQYFYSSPVKFILKNKISGIETAPSTDMDKILGAWNL